MAVNEEFKFLRKFKNKNWGEGSGGSGGVGGVGSGRIWGVGLGGQGGCERII